METPIPETVRALIAHRLASMDHVELLLLVQSDEQRWWTADEAASVLFGDTRFVASLLSDLNVSGFVERGPGADGKADTCFRYSASDGVTRRAVTDLRAVYEAQPMVLVQIVSGRSTAAGESFAKAFRSRQRSRD